MSEHLHTEPAEHAQPPTGLSSAGCAGSACHSHGDETTGRAFARSVLAVAAAVESAEGQIKQEILMAARAGDCQRVADIVLGWADMPALDALKAIRSAAPCES